MSACSNCGMEHPETEEERRKDRRTWWYLHDYYGVNGFFCPDCYRKVVHNAYNEPLNPKSYLEVLDKQPRRPQCSSTI